MIGGVSFQPGLQDDQKRRESGQGSSEGVQEAIKVLSLRLPRVVGAQAIAPSALLRSPGSGGNPRVDSIVESVLQKFFPGGSGGGAQAPMAPGPSSDLMGSLWGAPRTSQDGPMRGAPSVDRTPPYRAPQTPNVVVNPPSPPGDFVVDEDGRPIGPPPGTIAPFPGLPSPPEPPDLRREMEWLPRTPQEPQYF